MATKIKYDKVQGAVTAGGASEVAHYERASPTLLAQQPENATPLPSHTPEEWQALRAHLEGRLSGLRSWRSSWWNQTWCDLSEYILPRRSIWLTQSAGGMPSANNMSRGKQINTAIVDPAATLAVRTCTGGLTSGLASPSRPWFKIIPSIKGVQIDEAGRVWLDNVEDVMYAILAASNFYNSFTQECEDLIVFGTAPTIIYEDEQDLIRCYNPCVGEYYLSSSATMRVDGLYRVFVMTVSQIVGFFGVENCPKEIQKAWASKGGELDKEFTIAHSIEPNFAIDGDKIGKIPGNFTWREVFWVYGNAGPHPLSMRGFVDQPFTAARWSTQSNDAYGRSPGMDALPDVIQLQVMTRRMAEAIEKMVRPPLVADMQLKNQPSSILPGHVTYVQGLGAGTGMRPIYEVAPDVNHLSALIAQIQMRIKSAFFNDLFLMLEQAPNNKQTAYEVAQRVNEKLAVVGPVIEGLMNESLKPKLKRIFSIAKRKGLLPPMPDSLKNIPLNIEFVSMLALAQKAAATGGIERLAAFIGNLVAVVPDVVDNLDVDATVRVMNDLLGNPQSILHDEKTIQATRDGRAKAQQAAQQSATMNQGADTLNKGAQAAQVLSNTTVGAGNSVLANLMQ